jgi:AcrR family transcriptional regulator
MLAATAAASLEVGYAQMSVDDIVRRAGVSRRTFYEQFASKDDVFFAAFDEAAGRLVASVRAAHEVESGFAERVIAGFGAFLELLAASPAFAHMCIVDALAAGPPAIERRERVMAVFARLIEDSSTLVPRSKSLPALTAETIVGGVYEAIFRRISNGETARLPELLPDLIESALLPYLGEEAVLELGRQLRARSDAQPALGGAADA